MSTPIVATKPVVPPVVPPVIVPDVEANAITFEKFTCSRASTRLITPKGFRISFTAGAYITQNKEAIEYLKSCIESQAPGLGYVGTITSDDLNPEAALRAKHIAEYLAQQKLLTASDRDMGSTEAKAEIKPASTDSQPKA